MNIFKHIDADNTTWYQCSNGKYFNTYIPELGDGCHLFIVFEQTFHHVCVVEHGHRSHPKRHCKK